MNDPNIEKFCTAVENAIAQEADSERENQALKDKIAAAAEELLEDVAVELAMVTSKAFAITMLGIYRSGKYPGQLQIPELHELAQALVKCSPANQEVGNGEVGVPDNS